MTQDIQIRATGAVGAVVANVDLNDVNDDGQMQTLTVSICGARGAVFSRSEPQPRGAFGLCAALGRDQRQSIFRPC